MVQAVDDDGLRDKFCVLCSTLDMSDVCRAFVDGCRRLLFRIVRCTYHFLHHIHNLLFDHVQGLCVASRRSADDIVNLDIIVLLTYSSTVHGIGELDENRILFHNSLDMLAPDTNDTLVVLVRNMKGDGSRHFLLHKIKAVFGSIVLGPAYVDVKVVLIETIEYDLHVAYIPVLALGIFFDNVPGSIL